VDASCFEYGGVIVGQILGQVEFALNSKRRILKRLQKLKEEGDKTARVLR
jgi:hypothetical protein